MRRAPQAQTCAGLPPGGARVLAGGRRGAGLRKQVGVAGELAEDLDTPGAALGFKV
jgi:hypothetical protein